MLTFLLLPAAIATASLWWDWLHTAVDTTAPAEVAASGQRGIAGDQLGSGVFKCQSDCTLPSLL
jgi:hypothetical protein